MDAQTRQPINRQLLCMKYNQVAETPGDGVCWRLLHVGKGGPSRSVHVGGRRRRHPVCTEMRADRLFFISATRAGGSP